jgi:uncharacterized membrane protein YsdA (DUF1294 family)
MKLKAFWEVYKMRGKNGKCTGTVWLQTGLAVLCAVLAFVLFALIFTYLILISLVSTVVTIIDKSRARRQDGTRRVREDTLILLAAAGGAGAMLITMLMIRHKTRHVKFMLGLPIILLFQVIIVLYLSRLL